MKNLLFTSALVLSVLSIAHAQEFSIGPTIGINNAWIDNVPGDNQAQLGLNAGLTMVYSTEEHWGWGLDLKYSGEGVVTILRGETAHTRLNYFRAPLKVIYFFNSFGNDFRLKIYLGPSFGILAGGKTEQFLNDGTVKVNSTEVYEDFDLGLVFGTGFNYRIGTRAWLNVDLAYNHGITDIAKFGEGYNRNVNFNVGVAWGL
jgi:hypothetical protein